MVSDKEQALLDKINRTSDMVRRIRLLNQPYAEQKIRILELVLEKDWELVRKIRLTNGKTDT